MAFWVLIRGTGQASPRQSSVCSAIIKLLADKNVVPIRIGTYINARSVPRFKDLIIKLKDKNNSL
jgi:hypothetical protein